MNVKLPSLWTDEKGMLYRLLIVEDGQSIAVRFDFEYSWMSPVQDFVKQFKPYNPKP